MRTLQASTQLNQDHLDRVSRSFAFCIARLRGDFRFYVGHSYLMLRVLDTVEDAPWISAEHQLHSLREFNSFLEECPSSERLKKWQGSLLDLSLPSGEVLLLADTHRLFADFHGQLDAKVREALKRCALNMSRGMEYYASLGGLRALQLNSLAEVNRYCFFVAGVVGELLHDIYLSVHGSPSPADPEHMEDALHLGLFLQKVNILKDQQTDEREGRMLLPSRTEVLSSLWENAHRGLRYILRLPYEAQDYRVFCSWSLFLGLASLPFIEKSWSQKSTLKIPRLRTKLLLDQVESRIDSNEDLEDLFGKLLAQAELSAPGHGATELGKFPQFPQLYSGDLSENQLRSLGLI